MPSTFNARDAAVYEKLMGRWSRRLARLFVPFAGVAAGEKILDAGCGTGSLAFTAAELVPVAAVEGIDFSALYVAMAQERATGTKVTIREGDVCALPFANGSFDRALTQLVLQFVPEPAVAAAELRRVTRPGGVVAGAVWDSFGGMIQNRMFWDTAAMLDPVAASMRADGLFRPMTRPGALRRVWEEVGLADVEDTMLTIRMEYEDFADYWWPIAAGEGSMGNYVGRLDAAAKERLEGHLREAYVGREPDGPRSFAACCWAVRGTVPG